MVPDDTTRSTLLIGGGHAGPPGPDVRAVQGRRRGPCVLWPFCGTPRLFVFVG